MLESTRFQRILEALARPSHNLSRFSDFSVEHQTANRPISTSPFVINALDFPLKLYTIKNSTLKIVDISVRGLTVIACALRDGSAPFMSKSELIRERKSRSGMFRGHAKARVRQHRGRPSANYPAGPVSTTSHRELRGVASSHFQRPHGNLFYFDLQTDVRYKRRRCRPHS